MRSLFGHQKQTLKFFQVDPSKASSLKERKGPLNLASALNAIAIAEGRSLDELRAIFATYLYMYGSEVDCSEQEWFRLYTRYLGYELQAPASAVIDGTLLLERLPHPYKAIVELKNGEFAFVRDGRVYSNQFRYANTKVNIARIWLYNNVGQVLTGYMRGRIMDPDQTVVVPEEEFRSNPHIGAESTLNNVRATARWCQTNDEMIRNPQALAAYAFNSGGFDNVWQIDSDGDYKFEAVFECEICKEGNWLPVYQDKLRCSPRLTKELALADQQQSRLSGMDLRPIHKSLIADAARFMQASDWQYQHPTKGMFYIERAEVFYRATTSEIIRPSSRRKREISLLKARGFGGLERIVSNGRRRSRMFPF